MSSNQECLFSEEVILQFLIRLPIKSLFRFKCVCKSWRKLANEPYFIRQHAELSSTKTWVLLQTLPASSIYTKFTFVDESETVFEFSSGFLIDRVKIRASCGGLLCCGSITNRGVYYVCNPLTRQWITLPSTRRRPVSRYHPDDESTLVGIAYDHCLSKFSVVLAGYYRPFGRRALDCLVCQVYDSKTNTWSRSIFSNSDAFTHMNRNQVVYAYGALHWLTCSCSYILAFDLRNELWRKVWLPGAFLGEPSSRVYLLDIDGCLGIVEMKECLMVIWVLKDYYVGGNWVEVEKVNLRCVKGLVSSMFPISMNREYVLLVCQRQVLSYHRRSKVWKEVLSVKKNLVFPLWFSAYAYKGSLFTF